MYNEQLMYEGIDAILQRKIKRSDGGRNHCYNVHPTNKVEPYTSPDTMRRDRKATDINEYVYVEVEE